MNIGPFHVEEKDGNFYVKHNQNVLDVVTSHREAVDLANRFARAYELGYRRGASDKQDEISESKRYHYM